MSHKRALQDAHTDIYRPPHQRIHQNVITRTDLALFRTSDTTMNGDKGQELHQQQKLIKGRNNIIMVKYNFPKKGLTTILALQSFWIVSLIKLECSAK